MSESYDKRKQLVQPLIDEALDYLKRATDTRNGSASEGWIDLCSIGVSVGRARMNLAGVEGLTGRFVSLGSGIEDTQRALAPLETVMMSMWTSEDHEVRRALLIIFDRIVPTEIANLRDDPHGEKRYAVRARGDEEQS